MVVEAPLAADRLVEPWFSSLRERLGDVRLFDAHTHLGWSDPDGSCFDAGELGAALAVVDARGVVFPLAEPGSYREANNRMLAVAEAVDGPLVPFCRVDPRNGAVGVAERAVALGARGIKLHPRAEHFGLGTPEVRAACARMIGVRGYPRASSSAHRGRRVPGIHLILVAAAVARTPGLPRPELEAMP
jgi:hypothetical protein